LVSIVTLPFVTQYHDSNISPGTWIGRIHLIFQLPKNIHTGIVVLEQPPEQWPMVPLAYVEWYSPLPGTAHEIYDMYKVAKRKVPSVLLYLLQTSGRVSCFFQDLQVMFHQGQLVTAFLTRKHHFLLITGHILTLIKLSGS
jgi:hypothetical protein